METTKENQFPVPGAKTPVRESENEDSGTRESPVHPAKRHSEKTAADA